MSEVEFVSKCLGVDVSKAGAGEGQDSKIQALGKVAGDGWQGKNAQEEALVVQWLTVKSSGELDKAEGVQKLVQDLDKVLMTKSFVASNENPTVADLCLYFALKGKVDSGLVVTAPSFVRWFDQMQHSKQVRAGLGGKVSLVAFKLPDTLALLPPAGAPEVSAPAGGVAPAAAAGGKKGGKEKPAQVQQQKDQKQGGGKDKKQKEKKEAKSKAAPAPAADDDQPAVTKLDFRVGKIIKAWNCEGSDKLYCEEIDLGEDSPRQIASGLREYYSEPSELENRLVLVLCNLKPRKLAGFTSNGMVLCASTEGKGKVEFVDPPAGTAIGERVQFDELAGEPVPPNAVAKKKVLEAVAPNLKTNANKEVCWIDENGKEHIFKTSKGVIVAPTIAKGSVS